MRRACPVPRNGAGSIPEGWGEGNVVRSKTTRGEGLVGPAGAKSRRDVAVRPTGRGWEVAYDQAGMEELVAELASLQPALVLLEATGGMEVPLVAALASAALPVVVANPRQVRDFARATGKMAKTDRLDAAVLAHFGEAVRPPVRAIRDSETQALNALVARRHQVDDGGVGEADWGLPGRRYDLGSRRT